MLRFDVRRARAVVVGGGRAGTEKVARLVAAGADVVVVDPSPSSAIEAQTVTIRRRAFVDADVADAVLVVAATDDKAINDAVDRAGRLAGALVVRADRADGGGVAFVAQIERGPVSVGVSTGGVSPHLARLVRDRVDLALPAAIADLAALLAERPRDAARRGHASLPVAEALAALEAGDVVAARSLLGLSASRSD